MHFPSSAVVNICTPPGSPHTNTNNSHHGVILGICLGVFGWYVSTVPLIAVHFYWFLPVIASGTVHTGVLKISLAGANNLVPTTGLTPCIIIIHVYTWNYSGAGKNIDAR